MLRLALAFLVLLGLANSAAALEIGQTAPAFAVQDINGRRVSPSEYNRKIIVLEWNNPECPFVKKFYGAGKMQELQKAAVAEGVIWLTINSSADGKQGSLTPEQANKINKERGWSGTAYILDPHGKIGKMYEAKTTPHMYIINRDGNLAYQGAIDNKESANPEDIKTATNYVSEALAELKAEKKLTTPSTRAYGCSIKYAD
ncbi:MAG: redoxin domain-containing protein [Alphaproteobacteria bacterium]|nr:redoxin domain-containing protein [Alphaproteobacteria bacterium]